jgi:hypothetical protein
VSGPTSSSPEPPLPDWVVDRFLPFSSLHSLCAAKAEFTARRGHAYVVLQGGRTPMKPRQETTTERWSWHPWRAENPGDARVAARLHPHVLSSILSQLCLRAACVGGQPLLFFIHP